MKRRIFYLAHERARRSVAEFAMTAPQGWRVEFKEPAKKREQEERYHAMIGDIAKQCEHIGRRWDEESWKRLLVDEFADQMKANGEPLHGDGSVLPSLDGRRIVQLGIQTRQFYVKEASAFIEFLFAFGADRGVHWSDPMKVRE